MNPARPKKLNLRQPLFWGPKPPQRCFRVRRPRRRRCAGVPGPNIDARPLLTKPLYKHRNKKHLCSQYSWLSKDSRTPQRRSDCSGLIVTLNPKPYRSLTKPLRIIFASILAVLRRRRLCRDYHKQWAATRHQKASGFSSLGVWSPGLMGF